MTFSKALSGYNRVDTIEIDCGTFSLELRSYQSVFKELGDEQARLRSEGLLATDPVPAPRKRSTRTAAALNPVTVQRSDETPYLLGTKERDQRFFATHVIAGWKGLQNDAGEEVPYSPDTAMELFASPGGEELYNELLMASLDVSNFVGVQSIGEDAKN